MLYSPRNTNAVLSGQVPNLLSYFGPGALKAYWPFIGGSLMDFTGKGSDLTMVNTPYSKPGVFSRGTSYTFSGTTGTAYYLKAVGNSSASLQSASACSVALWAMVGASPSATAAFYEDLTSSWATGRFSILLNTSGYVLATAYSSAATMASTGIHLLTQFKWTHIVATWLSGSRLRLFVNGRYEQYAAVSGSTLDTTAGAMINIGARKTSGSDDTNTRAIGGYIADLGVFNRELSGNEIASYYRLCTSQGPLAESPVTKYFPSLYVAPPTAMRLRASATVQKKFEHRTEPVSRPANTYFPMENSALQNLGKTNTVAGTGTSVTYTSCPPLGGGAATLAGSSGSHISGGSANVAIVDTGFLVSFWIRWDNLTTGEYAASHENCLFGYTASGAGTFLYMAYKNSGHATVPDTLVVQSYNYSDATWRTNVSSVIGACVGSWFHFAAYIHLTDYTKHVWYKNGQILPGNTNANTHHSSFASPSTEFRVGWVSPGAAWASGFAGAMRELQIINHYVSPKEVSDYYTLRLKRYPQIIPATYTVRDAVRQRAKLHNRNSGEFLVKGDIRQIT